MGQEDEIWIKRLERERNARKQAEKLLEEKSLELYIRNAHLKDLTENQEILINNRTYWLYFLDLQEEIEY